MKKCLSLPAIRELETMGFCVATQPIVTGDTDGIPLIAGYELVTRFCDDDGTTLTPAQYGVKLAGNQHYTLDALLVQEAMGAAVSAESSELFFSFTLRALNLADAFFADYLLSRLGVMSTQERSRLVINISEKCIADNKSFSSCLPRLKRNLAELTEMGVRVCADGVSHRSNGFHLVSQLPVSVIKLCPKAIAAEVRLRSGKCLESEAVDLEVLRSFGLSMRAWNCMVIAGGIETKEQAPIAKEMGATHYQGTAFGAPLIESELPDSFEEPAGINRSYRGGDSEVERFARSLVAR